MPTARHLRFKSHSESHHRPLASGVVIVLRTFVRGIDLVPIIEGVFHASADLVAARSIVIVWLRCRKPLASVNVYFGLGAALLCPPL